MLHACVCLLIPSQSLPPFLGGGLEQVLFLTISPPPHGTSQPDHSVHSDHWPSTETENKNAIRLKPVRLIQKHHVVCSYPDRPAGNTAGCRTELRRRNRPDGRLSECSSAGKASPDHTTRCTDSRTSRETEYSRLGTQTDHSQSHNPPDLNLIWDLCLWTHSSRSHPSRRHSLCGGHISSPNSHTRRSSSWTVWRSSVRAAGGAERGLRVLGEERRSLGREFGAIRVSEIETYSNNFITWSINECILC